MTQEEKAKAYDEALKRAREICNADDSTAIRKEQLSDILPELRESEDERIRKWIISQMQRLHDEANTEGSWENFKMTDAAIYWLEKQKENTQTADSIPADCASNAKCEDRWHKVEDSLPNSGRDVLAKDELGNFLIANYDGEQWFISGYDDEDKPIKYTPAISEWCDIPSENQKEQKPNYCHHEVDETGWTEEYRKAYYDGWNNCNMQHEQLKAGQKPTEWSEEDEMKLGAIITDIETRSNLTESVKIKYVSFLKSLRPSWKPSEDQMEALDTILEHEAERVGSSKALEKAIALSERLQKLM